jgi:3-dehydroquinate dehydratase-2
MAHSIWVLNGPNLNRLGKREPEVYGHTTLAQIQDMCAVAAGAASLVFHQSNFEGELVEWIHDAIDEKASAIVINPAGLTFSSVSIFDALKMFPRPVIELHISNIHRRESIYHHSLVSGVATAIIAGMGADGYRLAVEAALMLAARGSHR